MRFKEILSLFLFWRVLLFVPLLVGAYALPFRSGFEYIHVPKTADLIIKSEFFSPWANFDGVHYLSIAGNGYQDNNRFLPLYPILIHATSFITRETSAFSTQQYLAAFTITNIYFLLALFVFNKLIQLDFKRSIAWQTIIYLLLFPTSFFFVSIYSESLFLLLCLLSFYFARKKKWLLAGIFGMLLSATRIPGIIILPALLCEFVLSEQVVLNLKAKKWRSMFFKASPLLLVPLGLIGYELFNLSRGLDLFYFFTSHGDLDNARSVTSIVTPFQTLFRYFSIFRTVPMAQFEWWIALLEICSFIFTTVCLFVAYKKKIRLSYVLFAAFAFALPIFSGTFTGLPRYVLVLFPIFIALALIKTRWIKLLYILISIALGLVLLLFFSRGYFIA